MFQKTALLHEDLFRFALDYSNATSNPEQLSTDTD